MTNRVEAQVKNINDRKNAPKAKVNSVRAPSFTTSPRNKSNRTHRVSHG